MANPADVEGTKAVRREFNKRMIDITQLDIRVTHGVCYLRGVVKPIKGGATDLKREIELIAGFLRTQGKVKDVVIDLAYRT